MILVSRRIKIALGVVVLMVCASVTTLLFRKEIRIAYHRNRMFAAGENYKLLQEYPLSTDPGPKPTRFTMMKSVVFRMAGMSAFKASEAMQQHEKALIELGALETREFTFTNRVFKGEGHCWPAFRQQITNALGNRYWWSGAVLETNRLAITAQPEDMPKWEKLIADFDR